MFDQKPILCIGDFIVDRFVEGVVGRISPEGPIPVLTEKKHFYTLGGAGNVIRNIVSLEQRAVAMSVIDKDRSGKRAKELLDDLPHVESVLIEDENWLTPLKTRFVANGQQLLRHDQEKENDLGEKTLNEIVKAASQHIKNASIVILSDYDKGLLTKELCQAVIKEARAHQVPVVVDPKGKDYSKYAGATILTPNLGELRAATGRACRTHEEIADAVKTLKKQGAFEVILVTLGGDGMLIADERNEITHIPATAKEVYDVSGAGDTVIATLSVILSQGLSIVDASKKANQAGGVVVGKIGTAVIYPHELEEDGEGGKIMLLPVLKEQVQRWHRQGYKVGFTNGCFDLLHLGHLHLLKQARAQCDRLVLGLNTDSSIKRLKGESRPIQAEHVRAQILAALEIVDAVILFDEDTPFNLISTLVPDVLVKGADYTVETVVGADVVMKNGGRVFLAQLKDGFSTTSTVSKMQSMG